MDRRSAVVRLAVVGAGPKLFGFSKQALQETGKRQEEAAIFQSEAVLVLLDVNVKDDQDRFVPGLSKENFTVLEDGRPQKITVFDDEDRPVSMGIVLDQSLSMAPKRQEVLIAARALIEERNRLDEVFVLHFNDLVTAGLPKGVPFSSDATALLAALARAVPGGKTALHDGLWQGLEHLRHGRHGRKTLVLISDGGDTASRHGRRETLERVERSLATIYTIGLYDEGDPDRDPGLLRRIAKTSGGESYLPSDLGEILGACRRIAKEIRTRYTVGYVPSEREGTGPLRRIEVRARDRRRGRLTVRTRSGYRRDQSEFTG